jgi:hypothetical protein
VERLAQEFQLPAPAHPEEIVGGALPMGYGRGECSLHSAKIRRALGVALPNIADSLARLREQCIDGYCDRLSAQSALKHQKVA